MLRKSVFGKFNGGIVYRIGMVNFGFRFVLRTRRAREKLWACGEKSILKKLDTAMQLKLPDI
jgi:hypothetical protein